MMMLSESKRGSLEILSSCSTAQVSRRWCKRGVHHRHRGEQERITDNDDLGEQERVRDVDAFGEQ